MGRTLEVNKCLYRDILTTGKLVLPKYNAIYKTDFMEVIMKKKQALFALALILLSGVLCASQMPAFDSKIARQLPELRQPQVHRDAPQYTFSRSPTNVITSFYDYMIGSYNALPLQVVPDFAYGGYMMTFHAKRTATSQRKAFYANLDNNGHLIGVNEIDYVTTNTGYPSLVFDPITAKPLYAWHGNYDTDPELETVFCADAYIAGFTGLFNDVQVVINNPITIISPDGTVTMDNEFLWPSMAVGPSPLANKRRVYILARNATTHGNRPSENPYIAYTDFNADDIEFDNPLTWSYTSIPELNAWNADTDPDLRRPFYGLACDNQGNLYYAGYHLAATSNNYVPIDEPDMDVFKCGNYGQGTWSRVSAYSHLPSWNPAATPSGAGYFTDDSDAPFEDNELYWAITNSTHLNAAIDDLGRLHFPAIFALTNADHVYYPALQVMKEVIFDPQTDEFSVSEIYPRKSPDDTFNQCFQPWDTEPPWGVPEYENGTLVLHQQFPFPHWDSTLHADAMFFHYNNIKITQGNGHGMLAAVWQDSQRARNANNYNDPEFMQYANTPEIWISVSSDNGDHWSDPIVLNNVDIPQFAGIKPMWVYPANQVKYFGTQGDHKVGKLGLMFYDDYTWGAYVLTPPAHYNNDGGRVMFAELEIVFPIPEPVAPDPFGTPVTCTGNSTVFAGVVINGLSASAGDVLAAFVDIDGTEELRGKSTIQIIDGFPACQLMVGLDANGEEITFKVWEHSSDEVYDVSQSIEGIIGSVVGGMGNNLFWLTAGGGIHQNISLQEGWNMVSLNVHPSNVDISHNFRGIIEHIEVIKSPLGVYQPGNPFNTLTQLTDGGGYFLNTALAYHFTPQGEPIDPQSPIALQAGWNLVAFTPQSSIQIEAALASISDYLIQVKGVDGVYEPDNPYNTLSVLQPGKAYWMKLNEDAVLVYAEEDEEPEAALARVALPELPVIKPNSMTMLISLPAWVQAGDWLMVYADTELRGIAEVIDSDGCKGVLLQVFGDEPGEQMRFTLKSSQSSAVSELYPGVQSAPGSIIGSFGDDVYYALSGGSGSVPELVTDAMSAYPNPFFSSTNIKLSFAKIDEEVKVEIFNIRGQKIRTLHRGAPKSQNLELVWDGKDDKGRNSASGVYFCRLHRLGSSQKIKLLLLK